MATLARALLALALPFAATPALATPALATPLTVPTPAGPAIVEIVAEEGRPQERVLIVGLHGYGMDERQIKTLVHLDLDFPHLYVALRASVRLPNGRFAWFPISVDGGTVAAPVTEVTDATDRLAAMLPALATHFGIADTATYVVGYSQGGTLALALAFREPRSADGFAGFAGSLAVLEGQGTVGRGPVLLGHGTLDPLISDDAAQETATRLRAVGRTVQFAPFRVPHVVSAAGRAAIAGFLSELEEKRRAHRPICSNQTDRSVHAPD